MSRRATVTQAEAKRFIKAVVDAGLPVTRAIRKSDGTVIVETVLLAPSVDQESLERVGEVVL